MRFLERWKGGRFLSEVGKDDQTGVAWKKSSMAWDGDKDNIKNKRNVLKKADKLNAIKIYL